MSNINETPKRLKELDDRLKKLESDGDGGDNGGMDAWKDAVNTRLDRIDGDIRHLLYGVIGSFIILGGMLITSYLMLDSSIKQTDQSVQKLITSVEVVKSKLE